ncbi:MAG: hypothetical protein ACT4OK_14785 [Gemmobacter sp.]
MEHDMPAETHEASRPVLGHRWLAQAVKTASQPLPALPFDRANRVRPASLDVTQAPRPAAFAAH